MTTRNEAPPPSNVVVLRNATGKASPPRMGAAAYLLAAVRKGRVRSWLDVLPRDADAMHMLIDRGDVAEGLDQSLHAVDAAPPPSMESLRSQAADLVAELDELRGRVEGIPVEPPPAGMDAIRYWERAEMYAHTVYARVESAEEALRRAKTFERGSHVSGLARKAADALQPLHDLVIRIGREAAESRRNGG